MSLNEEVWCKLAPSQIHEIGVFAIRDIPKGQKLYCHSASCRLRYEPIDDLLPEIRQLILQRWPNARTNGYLNPNDDARLISFMNHSPNPNYDWFTDLAIKDIPKGTEVLEDYGYDPLTQET